MGFAVFAAIAGPALFVWGWLDVTRQSRSDWRKFATENGFAPVAKPVFTGAERKAIPLLHRGFGQTYICPCERMFDAALIRTFDFRYSFGAPFVANTSYTQTVIAIRPYAWNFPDFELHAATSLDKLGAKLAGSISARTSRPVFPTDMSCLGAMR